MDTKSPKIDERTSSSSAKKPYDAPVLKEWGTLKDITLSANGSRGNDNSSRSRGGQRTS